MIATAPVCRIDLDLADRAAGRIGRDAADESSPRSRSGARSSGGSEASLAMARAMSKMSQPEVRARRHEEAVVERRRRPRRTRRALRTPRAPWRRCRRTPRPAACRRAASSGPNACRRRPRTTAVSPVTSRTCSGVTPSWSASTCAKVVSWPCPLDCVPATTSTKPSARTLTSHMLARHADRRFDVVRKADAGEPAALLRRAAARRKALPVGELEHRIHVAAEISAVVGEPGRGAIGQLRAADQVAPADGDAVDAEAPRRDVDQPLDRERRLRPPGAAERRGRHRVGERAADASPRRAACRRPSARRAIGVRQRHIGHRMRADIAGDGEAIGEDAAVGGEREAPVECEIAALVIGEEASERCWSISPAGRDGSAANATITCSR